MFRLTNLCHWMFRILATTVTKTTIFFVLLLSISIVIINVIRNSSLRRDQNAHTHRKTHRAQRKIERQKPLSLIYWDRKLLFSVYVLHCELSVDSWLNRAHHWAEANLRPGSIYCSVFDVAKASFVLASFHYGQSHRSYLSSNIWWRCTMISDQPTDRPTEHTYSHWCVMTRWINRRLILTVWIVFCVFVVEMTREWKYRIDCTINQYIIK